MHDTTNPLIARSPMSAKVRRYRGRTASSAFSAGDADTALASQTLQKAAHTQGAHADHPIPRLHTEQESDGGWWIPIRRPAGSSLRLWLGSDRHLGCRSGGTFSRTVCTGRTVSMADGMIRLTLDGTRHELSRAVVEARLSDVLPELVRKHAVRVNDTWFPVIQALETATGIPRSEFISHTARRHLTALGFEVRGEIDPTHARRTLAQPSERECLRRPHGPPCPPTPPLTRPGTRRRTSRPPSSPPLPVRAGGFCPWPTPPPRSTASMCAALVSRAPTIRRPALRTRLDLRRFWLSGRCRRGPPSRCHRRGPHPPRWLGHCLAARLGWPTWDGWQRVWSSLRRRPTSADDPHVPPALNSPGGTTF